MQLLPSLTRLEVTIIIIILKNNNNNDVDTNTHIKVIIPDGKLNYREFCELMHSKEKRDKS